MAVRLVGRIVLFPNPRTNLGRCRPRSGPGYPVQGSAPFLRVRIVASRFVPLSETDRLRTPSETMSGT